MKEIIDHTILNASTLNPNNLCVNNLSDNILNYSYTAFIIVNQHGNIIYVNQATEDLFVKSSKQMQRYNIDALLKPVTNHGEASNKSQNFELKPFITHDQWITGTQKPLFVDYSINVFNSNVPVNSINVSNTYDDNQETHYLIEIWTKDRQYHISQEQTQHNQYKIARKILRSVAHEVKNPLAGIRGATQLLQRMLVKQISAKNGYKKETNTTSKQDKIDTYTNIIISETDRLSTLISQLLGTHLLPSLMPLNVHEPLEHVLTLIESQQTELKIIRDYDLSLPNIGGDKDQLIQIFLNIINNALQAMDERAIVKKDVIDQNDEDENQHYQPTLIISSRVEFQRTINNYQSITHKKIAKITIHDNGIGIPDALIEQIFFPLVTSRADGSGLGLSLVHEMIQRHNGQIEVFSRFGDTRFVVYIPFKE